MTTCNGSLESGYPTPHLQVFKKRFAVLTKEKTFRRETENLSKQRCYINDVLRCIHYKDQRTSLRDSIKVTKNGEVLIGNPHITSVCMNILATTTNFGLPIDRLKNGKYFEDGVH